MEPLEDRRLLSYTIINLGSLGGTVSVPVEVNNHGEVVGLLLYREQCGSSMPSSTATGG